MLREAYLIIMNKLYILMVQFKKKLTYLLELTSNLILKRFFWYHANNPLKIELFPEFF